MNTIHKPLRLGVTAFFVGLCGIVLGFSIDYGPHNPLSFVAFGVVAFAVILGFISIGWGWAIILRQNKTGRR